jgi:23S rRNA pseudouridine1911/1915/1917 synthase
VSPADEGLRLDVLVARELDLGRAPVRRLLDGGQIRVGGRVLGLKDKSLVVRAGTVIEVAPSPTVVQPQSDLPLMVLAQGDGWVVVDKPAGMPVHPLRPGERGTVLNAVAARWPAIQGVGEGGLRSGVVHRLDVDTSGVLALALDEATWQRLRRAFSSHTARKTYRAIVHGRMTGQAREEMNLVVATHRPARVRVVEPGREAPGMRRCRLAWRAVAQLNDATLIEVDLGTGFLHQIRVMLAHLGHPVLGDRLYGRPDDDVPRQMLHACRIEIGQLRASSPDPADLAQTLLHLGAVPSRR